MLDLRDPVSSASHLLTSAWAVFATLVMWRLAAKRPGRLLPVIIYGASMILLFLASGTFHGLHYNGDVDRRRFFQKLDQSAIYLLIAGSYTPVLSILLQGAWRKWFLRMTWTFALAGVGCLWLLPKTSHELVVALYLGVGWAGFVPIIHYYRAVGWRAMNWVWGVAGFYSAGAICELAEWPVIVPGFGFHEILHLCDTAGCITLFLFVVRYVIPYQPQPRTEHDSESPAIVLPFPSPRGTMNAS